MGLTVEQIEYAIQHYRNKGLVGKVAHLGQNIYYLPTPIEDNEPILISSGVLSFYEARDFRIYLLADGVLQTSVMQKGTVLIDAYKICDVADNRFVLVIGDRRLYIYDVINGSVLLSRDFKDDVTDACFYDYEGLEYYVIHGGVFEIAGKRIPKERYSVVMQDKLIKIGMGTIYEHGIAIGGTYFDIGRTAKKTIQYMAGDDELAYHGTIALIDGDLYGFYAVGDDCGISYFPHQKYMVDIMYAFDAGAYIALSDDDELHLLELRADRGVYEEINVD